MILARQPDRGAGRIGREEVERAVVVEIGASISRAVSGAGAFEARGQDATCCLTPAGRPSDAR